LVIDSGGRAAKTAKAAPTTTTTAEAKANLKADPSPRQPGRPPAAVSAAAPPCN